MSKQTDRPTHTPKGKDVKPDKVERDAREAFLVALGLTPVKAKELSPATRSRREQTEILKAYLRTRPKKRT